MMVRASRTRDHVNVLKQGTVRDIDIRYIAAPYYTDTHWLHTPRLNETLVITH